MHAAYSEPDTCLSIPNACNLIMHEDRPVVYWQARDRETVSESDLVLNYDLVNECVYTVGGSTPPP